MYFYHLKSCGKSVLSKPIIAISFKTACVYFMSLCHVLIFITIFQMFLLLFHLLWLSMLSDFWCYFVMVLGSYKPYPRKTVNLNDKHQMHSDCSTDRLSPILVFLFQPPYSLTDNNIEIRTTSDPTPVLLPGKSHGQRNLVGCSPWGREKSDMTERLHFHFSLLCIGEGNGNPLQCSCLENSRDGVAQSQTWLKWLSSDTTMAYKCPNIKRSPTYLTLNQKLEIIKLSEKWMSRVKTGWKLGLLHQLHGVNLKKLFLKEIKNATLMYTGMIRNDKKVQ